MESPSSERGEPNWDIETSRAQCTSFRGCGVAAAILAWVIKVSWVNKFNVASNWMASREV